MHIIASLVEDGFMPFAFGAKANLDQLHPAPFGAALRMIPSDGPDHLSMHRIINRLNGLAYGGKDMGMPAWVQIDCGALPSSFIGFALPADKIPDRLKWAMDLQGDEPFIPVAEAISIPTAAPGVWTSFSMSTVIPGHKLGYASKLMSLKAYGCRRTLGVAQFDNFALRLHTRFGALEIIEPRVPYHTCPTNTFTYALDLRGGAVLDVLERGGAIEDPRSASFLLDSQDTEKMTWMAERRHAGIARYWLLPPGADRSEGRVQNPIFEEIL
jgi:hypothetical protein